MWKQEHVANKQIFIQTQLSNTPIYEYYELLKKQPTNNNKELLSIMLKQTILLGEKPLEKFAESYKIDFH